MFSLSGKTALVTGASGGIGSDIARALYKQGATVTLSGTRREALEALQKELGERAHIAVCNLSDSAQVDELPKTAEGLMGGLDILVCNAGITRDNLFMRMKDEEWDEVIKVNLTSTFRLSRAVMSNIRQNLFLAFIYNAAGVPVAAGVLYPALGLLLSPIIAAAAMALSSVSVIGNSLRLRAAKL